MIGDHSFRFMFEREIQPEDLLDVIRNGESIKEYPDDKPYPSFLILKFVKESPIHVVGAKNIENGLCFDITVYEPDPEIWSKDFKKNCMSNTCPICKNGTLKPGFSTVTVEREEALIIFKEVPADVCDNCGSYFLNESISAKLYKKADQAIKNGAQLEILKLTA